MLAQLVGDAAGHAWRSTRSTSSIHGDSAARCHRRCIREPGCAGRRDLAFGRFVLPKALLDFRGRALCPGCLARRGDAPGRDRAHSELRPGLRCCPASNACGRGDRRVAPTCVARSGGRSRGKALSRALFAARGAPFSPRIKSGMTRRAGGISHGIRSPRIRLTASLQPG